MRFGVVILPDQRWATARRRWEQAEALGFHHAWTYDHLTWRTLREGPWFATIPTLTAAALATTRIRLGTLVASPNFRHPVPFAKELMTLDDVSEGRLIAGLGAGGMNFDARALGGEAWTLRERSRRFREFVTLLDRLLCERATTYAGAYYSAHEARAIPGCIQKPRIPFAIAATGPRGMQLAARLAQIWVTVDSRSIDREQVARLDDACTACGRDPATLDRLALIGLEERPLRSTGAFADAVGRYQELGFTDLVVHWPRAEEPFQADERILEEIAARGLLQS
jgi:alkanesulfonate monooxygenase SsuD/methylene tetrahydromethanopterin reductase-like flavin-dependent oxidoreductase (luciferase family)